jgi:hypothetical protein
LQKTDFVNALRKHLNRAGGRLLALLLLAGATPAAAQYYTTGEDPAWISWRQIRSRHFQIIYPAPLDAMAQRYARLFDAAADSVSAPLGARLPHLPVVLHAYNVASNGVVVWAPARMELITTPPLDGYPQAWDKQLVLHETRHVAQMSKTGEHAVKVLHALFGEQAEGAAAGIYIPGWFLEGDATVSETALSNAGRGRSANFFMAQKAYITDGIRFKWDTWKNGSFRYLIPNEYVLGYRMAAYAYLQGGRTVFDRTLDYTTRRLLAIPPFNRGLRRYAGLTERQLEAQSFAALREQYAREDALRGPDIPHRALTTRTDDYQAFRYPTVTADHRIIALRSSLNRTAHLVEIDTAGHVRTLRQVGAINSHLHHNRGVIYWTEAVPAPRWPQLSYSVIKAFDIATRTIYTLTRKTRFFGVSVNADGSALLTVEQTPDGQSRLVSIPLAMQERRPHLLLNRALHLDAAPHQTWKHVAWRTDTPENHTRAVATLLTDDGLGLYDVNLATGARAPLLPDGFRDIKRLTTLHDAIVFESDYDGASNLYALRPGERHVYRLTNARLGAFDPAGSPDGRTIAYANYHTRGYEIVQAAVDSLLWAPDSFAQPYRHAWADSLSALFRFNLDTLPATPAAPAAPYPSTPYRKAAHLFRFHSWAPVYINPDGISELSLEKFTDDVGLGVTLFSQNTLGTAVGRLGYRYANGFHSGHLEFIYKGWYPVVELNLDVNDRKAFHYAPVEKDNKLYLGQFQRNDPYVEAAVRLYVPFNFSRNGWQRGLIPQVDAHFTNEAYLTLKPWSYGYFYSTYYLRYVLGGFTWYNRRAMAHRELFPRWGYQLRALHLNHLTSEINIGRITSIQLTAYVPGLLPNHSLQLKAGRQWQDIRKEGIYYASPFSLLTPPRGYQRTTFEQETVLNADYSFPLFYPHWNIGWLAYFNRIQMNLFSDYALIRRQAQEPERRLSVGIDLTADAKLLRFAFPVSAGLRCAFPLAGEPLAGRPAPTVSLLFDIRFE